MQATTPKNRVSVAGAATIERRGPLVRVNLLTLSITNPANAAGPRSPLPPGGYCFLIDTSSRVYTIWSPSRRTYYSDTWKPPIAIAAARPTPAPSALPGGGVASLLASLKDLRQFNLSVSLSPDKTPIDGHPTTNFDFRFTRQMKGQDPADISGRASFADDLAGFPLFFAVTATAGRAGSVRADVRVALSGVKQTAPPQSDFTAPSGYRKVSSILDVIAVPTAPSPSPSPSA